MNIIAGIQMIGTQRSGSNLLRVILDQSPEIASPHPPHILVTFMPLLDLYGPLTDNENYRCLVSDVVDYVNANPVPWEGVSLDKEKIITASANYSLFEINRIIYEEAALSKNARMWCCKSMNNVYFSDELEVHGSVQKYIYLYRDGRDVAASFKKAIVGEKHIYSIARQWKQDQEACLKLKNEIPAGRFFSLNYERLISYPEQTVKELCLFLGVDYTVNMLQYHHSQTSKVTAAAGEMWKNLDRPIMHHNTGNFLKSFKENDLEIFELVSGEMLHHLGYPQYSSALNYDLISPAMIELYKAENAGLKKQSLKDANEEDLKKRRPQERLLAEIKDRVLV